MKFDDVMTYDGKTAVAIADFSMKFLPLFYREKTTQHFGKSGFRYYF